MKCPLCNQEVLPQSPVVASVGGFFTSEDPDLFLSDDEVMREGYIHRDCFIKAMKEAIET